MPLTRPKKNPSRSPGISSASYFQSSSTPKGFHPPSYYAAAAAGLSSSHPDQDKSSDAQTHRTTTTDRTVVDFDYSFVPAPMPTAQLPVSSSASSTEPSLVSRMSFLNRRLSKGNGTGNKSSSKRRSQLTDLPLVEAQLVPSLRDTIDRMTNSPNSQTHSPAIGSHASSQINPSEALHSPSQHFQYPSTPRTRQQQTGYLRIVPTPSPSTPKFSSAQESSRIPTPVAAAKSKSGLKPALKNAVASSSVSNSGQGNQSSPTKASPARSLRSVKGIIGRKTPQIPADIAPLDMATTQVRDYPARERSRTDPGHVTKIPSLSPHVQPTPRMPPPVSMGPTPGRAPRGIPLHRRYAAISDSSGSELNLHGERGRALFVTNAVIVPSSSSSSEEVEASQAAPIRNSPAWTSRAHQENYPYDRRLAQQGVGLGLGMSDRIRDTHSHVRPLAESGRIDADAESEYHSDLGDEDEDHLAVSSSASSAHLRSLIQNRQTLRPPDLTRNVSTTSGDSLPNPWDMDSSGSGHDEIDQRRRELIELVKGMEKGPFGSPQPYEFDSMSDDEYVGEHGLAISPSDDFSQNTNTTLRPGDEDGGHSRRRTAVAGPSHATPRQPFTQGAPAGERAEHHSSSRKLPGTYDRVGNQATLVLRNGQETESSPLSQYSGDDDGKYSPGNTKDFSSSTRNNRSPITQDGPLFRSIREGDRPLSSRESPGRIPRKNIAPITSMRRDSFGTEGSSQRTNRAIRDAATSLPKTGLPEAHVAGGIQSLSRVRERKVTRQPPTRVQGIPLPHSDSTSSIESRRWHNEDQDISVDAEAIFEQLGTQNQSTTNGTLLAPSQRQERGQNVTSNRSSKSPLPRETLDPLSQPKTDLYESHGGHNAYEGANPILLPNCDERNSPTPEHERRTWLSTITSSAYHSLLDRYGEVEIQRQQIIWDLCETERAFVRRLRTFVRVFIRPLRMKDSVSWLAGVPPEVARLFDWLEDLINIHAQISSALRAIVSEQYPIVMRIAGRIRSFVSRLEVHQPYVVRLESTTLLIKRLTAESSSDFGEFIRIQQEHDECHGWSVEAFLVEPVNRLVDYPIHFKRLLDVTPRDHPDHLATFSLLHCTETMIRVMREVKLQEEEYALVKERLGKISGLPTSLQLAHRSRRLLARGRLERDYPRDRVRISTNGGTLRENERSDPATGVRQSRLISAIQSRAMRSDSMRTTSESTTSIASHFSRDLPTTPYPPQRLASASSSIHPNLWDGQYATARNVRHSLGPLGLGQHTQTLYVLVFNDIVLLTSPALSGRHDSDQVAQIDSWCLLEGIGLSRVLKVVEDSNQIILDLLPVDPENVATGVIPDSGQVIILTLSIPSMSSAGVRLDTPSLSRLRQNWISAFQECAEHTLRALSFPTQSGKLVAPTPGVAWDNDAQTSVSAILASGLPLPKSPSTQLAEQGIDPAQQEREARGWWALRFQQVLREMQSGSSGGALITISPGTSAPSRETAGKRVRSQPRVLKLSSLSSSESIVNRPP